MYYSRRGSILLASVSVISSLCLLVASYLYHKEIIPWDLRVLFMILHLPGHILLNTSKDLFAQSFSIGGHISTFFVFVSNAVIYGVVGWLLGLGIDTTKRQGGRKPIKRGAHH